MHVGIVFQNAAIPASEDQGYLEALLALMPPLAPQHTFTIFTNEDASIALPSPMKVLRISFPATYFGLKRLYSKTLPALVKREGIDAFITINCAPANLSVSYLPVMLSPVAAPEACTTWLRFLYRCFLTGQLKKAAAVAVVSPGQQQEVQHLLGVKESQLFATGYAVPAGYQPVDDWQQRELFLQEQTGGREYFLYTGHFSEERFLYVLKAFSYFKKRQQSNMLLLVPLLSEPGKKLLEKLDSYKYRQDVQLLNHPDKSLFFQLTACSYAVLFAEANSTTVHSVAAAVQCAVPVIGVESNEELKETAGAAALYADASVEGFAEQMKQLYKDETLRQRLVVAARQQAKKADGRAAALSILTQTGAINQ